MLLKSYGFGGPYSYVAPDDAVANETYRLEQCQPCRTCGAVNLDCHMDLHGAQGIKCSRKPANQAGHLFLSVATLS